MAHISYTELRANLAGLMDEVCDSRAPLVVTRQNARSVVMLSEAEYDGLMETVHLLRSPANAARLFQSIDQANKAALAAHKLIAPGAAKG
ncbi:MAG: type II toxin-antitoxin system Phd/YefM family antitoxin [Pseudolabrys sp.]